MSCKHVVFGVVLLGALASPIAAQTGPVSLDLSGAGLNLTILAPQGATAAKNADEPTEVEVRLLPNFALLVSPGKVATARMKAVLGDTWKPGTVGAALARGFKLVVDTPDALLYETPSAARRRFASTPASPSASRRTSAAATITIGSLRGRMPRPCWRPVDR